jgi:hypothetical protein
MPALFAHRRDNGVFLTLQALGIEDLAINIGRGADDASAEGEDERRSRR